MLGTYIVGINPSKLYLMGMSGPILLREYVGTMVEDHISRDLQHAKNYQIIIFERITFPPMDKCPMLFQRCIKKSFMVGC
jgi:hypothetical protein